MSKPRMANLSHIRTLICEGLLNATFKFQFIIIMLKLFSTLDFSAKLRPLADNYLNCLIGSLNPI